MFNVLTRKKLLAAVSAFSFFIASGNSAAELLKKGPSVFNYNFLEVKLLDSDGFGLTGSADVQQNIAVRVDFSEVDTGPFGDSSALRLGGTYYIQSKSYPQADWVFGAGLDSFSSDTGLFLSAGTRYAINDALEVNGAIELTTIGDTDFHLNLAALYEFSPGFSGFVAADVGDGSQLVLGMRFYWR